MARNTSLKSDVLTPDLLEALRALNDIAARRGQSLAQMSLAWLLTDPRVTSVIIGASSVAQIEDDLKALENRYFSEEEIAQIDDLFVGKGFAL